MDDHYELLGLPRDATREEIEVAIDRLAEQAALLVFTSPVRAQSLWERIRRMRRDLLGMSGPQSVGEEARLRTLPGANSTVAETPWFALPAPDPEAQGPEAQAEALGPIMWSMLAGIASVAVVALVLALTLHRPSAPTSTSALAMALSSSGTRRGDAYVSGQTVKLSWTRVPGASFYRLQVATWPSDPSDSVVFRHPLETVLTDHPPYALKVVGTRFYYWRVQAFKDGKWSPFTHSRHFAVARPSVKATVPNATNRVAGVAPRTRVCWHSVKGARVYTLLVAHHHAVRVSGTCAAVTLRVPVSRVSVAALVPSAAARPHAVTRPTAATKSEKTRSSNVRRHQVRPSRRTVAARRVSPIIHRPVSPTSVGKHSNGSSGAARPPVRKPTARPARPPSVSPPPPPPLVPAVSVERPTGTARTTAGGASARTRATAPAPPSVPARTSPTAPSSQRPGPSHWTGPVLPSQPNHPAHPIHPAHPAHPAHP